MTLLLRNTGFSLDVDERDNGSIWDKDALQWMNRFFQKTKIVSIQIKQQLHT